MKIQLCHLSREPAFEQIIHLSQHYFIYHNNNSFITTILWFKRWFKNEINTETLDFFSIVKSFKPPILWKFEVSEVWILLKPLQAAFCNRNYRWLFMFILLQRQMSSIWHWARGFKEFPGQQRASSAQSLPASKPLEAALPPPNSLFSLIQHPQVLVVHVKPQLALGLGCFKEYLSLFSPTPYSHFTSHRLLQPCRRPGKKDF